MTTLLHSKHFFLFLILILSFSSIAFGDNPPEIGKHDKLINSQSTVSGQAVLAAANNECAGATSLAFGVKLFDNNIGATQSQPPNTCNFFTPANANDVWYTFMYTAQMDCVVVVPNSNPTSDIIIELFSGACGNLTFIGCSNFAEQNNNNQTEGIDLSNLNLTVGNSYKLRVYGYNGVEAPYYVLLKTGSALPPPPNNDCSLAQTAPGGTFVVGTTVGATQSIAPITCQTNTSTVAKDVWYKFTKTSTMDSLILSSALDQNLVVEIRSISCAGGTSLLCSDKPGNLIEKIPFASLVNGTQYLIRIYGFNGLEGGFAFKIKNAPGNNNCAGAKELLASAGQIASGTTDATQSLPPSTCLGTPDDDVWFQFVMAEGLDSVKVEPIGSFNAIVELRSGTCANSTAIRCSNGVNASAIEKIYVGNLIVGNTYFVRVYSLLPSFSGEGSFYISLNEVVGLPPVNDGCTSPIQITSGSVINGTNTNATQTAPSVACGGAQSSIVNDVWYRFTKTDVIDSVRVNGLGLLDLVMDIRENTCPGGALVACSNIPGTGVKTIDINNLVNGSTYLLRVYGWEGATGDFTIEFLDKIVVVTPPPNDDCFDAQSLILGSVCTGTSGTNAFGTESLPASVACSGANPGTAKDVWYSFTANSTKSIIRLTCSINFDGAVQVYSGSCFSLNSVGCADNLGASNDPDYPAVEEVFLQGLVNGQTYYVRVYGYNGTEGNFEVCVYNPNCNSAVAALSTNLPSVLSNQAFSTNVTGADGLVEYQYSSNQINWSPITAIYGTMDTLLFSATINGTIYLRASNRAGQCYPSVSNVVQMAIRCATPLIYSSGSDRITKITFGSINQSSTINPMGGNVQDFSSVSTPMCRGISYPLGITVGNATNQYNRLAWIDFNQDGDFADPGENVLFGPYVSGAITSSSISIPANAPLGSCRMRIAIIDNLAAITSSDACATGPYDYGEIEEYTLNVTTGLLSNAGTNQTVCGSTATLAGNDPGAGAGGLWMVVSGTGTFASSTSFNSNVSGLSAGANVFRWTLNNTCGSSQTQVTITSSNLTANAGTDQSVCLATATLGAIAPLIGTGVWTVLAGGSSVSAPTNRLSGVTGLAMGVNTFIWTVTGSIPGCPAVKDTILVTRLVEPSNAVAGTDQSFCGNSAILAGNAPSVGTGAWSVVSGTGTFVNGSSPTTTVNGLAAGANTFKWTISNGSCTPKSDDVIITVSSPPNAGAGIDQTICTTSVALSGNAAGTGVTGTWTLLSGTGTIMQPSLNSTAVTALGTGTNLFIWTLTKTGCPDDKDTVAIIRNSPPTANAGSSQSICGPQGTFAATIPSSGAGAWTLISGSGTIANPVLATSAFSGLGYGANVFRWTVSSAPCTPSTSDVSITNNLPVKPNAGTDQTVCSGNGQLNTSPIPGALTGSWSVLAGGSNLATPNSISTTVSNLALGLNSFAFTVAVPACSTNLADTISLTRQANPIDLGRDTIVCSNITPTYIIQGPPSMTSYVWSSGQNTPSLTVSTPAIYILTVQTLAGCQFKDTVDVQFQICGAVSSMIGNNLGKAQIVPNPSSGQARIAIQLSNPQEIQITILDMKGSQIGIDDRLFVSEMKEISLPAIHSPGVYQVKIAGKNFIKTLKWVVNK